jgi:hypothetical protein
MEWCHSGSPHPKKYQMQKSTGKIITWIFWDQDGILHTDYLPKGQIINTEYHLSLLVQLNNILKEKCHARLGHQSGLVLARQCPGSPDTCNLEETGLPGLPLC